LISFALKPKERLVPYSLHCTILTSESFGPFSSIS
jgi:hypothetical protein